MKLPDDGAWGGGSSDAWNEAALQPSMPFRTDAQGALASAGAAWSVYAGLSVEQLAQRGWAAVIDAADLPERNAAWRTGMARGMAFSMRLRVRRHDGQRRWHLVRLQPLRHGDGLPHAWLGSATDMHDLPGEHPDGAGRDDAAAFPAEPGGARAEAGLQRREAYLDAVLQALPVGVLLADAEGALILSNEAFRSLWGMVPPTRDCSEYGRWEGYWPETGARIQAHEWALVRALRQGEVVRGELVEAQPFDDGPRRFLLSNAAPVRDARGRIVGGVAVMVDVTGQRAAQLERERLLTAQTLARGQVESMLEAISDAFFALNHDWRFTYVNDRAQQVLGVQRAELLGRSVWEAYAPAVGTVFEREYRRAMAQGVPVAFEAHYPPLEMWFEVRAYPGRQGLSVYFQDITARRVAEERLQASEARLQAVFDAAPVGLLVAEAPGGRIVQANRQLEEILGHPTLPAQDVQGYAAYAAFDADGRPVPPQDTPLARALAGEERPQKEMLYRRGDGHLTWIRAVATPLRDAQGGINGALVAVVDIDQERRAIDALQERTAQLAQTRLRLDVALTGGQLGVWDWNVATGESWWTRQMFELLGLPQREDGAARADLFMSMVHPEDRGAVEAAIAQAMEGQEMFEAEMRLVRADGRQCWVLGRAKVLRDEWGQPLRLVGVNLDITAQKAAQARIVELNATLEAQVQQRTAELQRTAARERAILCSAASAIVATDLEGRITSFNPAAEAMFRLTAQAALGRPVVDLYDPEDCQTHLANFPPEVLQVLWPDEAARFQGSPGSQRSEWRYVRADGTRFPGLLSVSVLRDAQGAPKGLLGIVTDLTERKALEEALHQRTHQAEAANRAKSAFLAHMSHEIRTPLNAVIGLSDLLRRRALPEDAARFVSHIHGAGEQLLALVSDVLDLSRIEAGEMVLESVDFEPRQLLEAALAMVQPQAGAKGLALACDIAPDLPARLYGDPLRLRQVLLNLLSNAVKFTPSGSVTLHVGLLARKHQQVLVRLDVADTGIGIAPEQQQRIFEPFTQADGSITRRFGGTGLGLSIVRRLVDMMGGTLLVHSQPGQGSTFSIKLPMTLAGED
ncbi:PAS domain S-box protein [Azohydromonas aeria]|uniref:PAS domain S-box protein n=1 Tax=Azohydromonas aeria TaxID=2590212 RepID=UPI0018DF148F|nr:PAS domain S-box protein [Azohydromonas aeria]